MSRIASMVMMYALLLLGLPMLQMPVLVRATDVQLQTMFPQTAGDYAVGVVAKLGVEAAFSFSDRWLPSSKVCRRFCRHLCRARFVSSVLATLQLYQESSRALLCAWRSMPVECAFLSCSWPWCGLGSHPCTYLSPFRHAPQVLAVSLPVACIP